MTRIQIYMCKNTFWPREAFCGRTRGMSVKDVYLVWNMPAIRRANNPREACLFI